MSMEENVNLPETPVENGHLELLRTIRIRSISFWFLLLFIIVMTLFLAKQPLYFFNFLESDPQIPLTGQVFRFLFYLLVSIAFIYQLWFSLLYVGRIGQYIRYREKAISEEDFQLLKKRYSWFDLLNVIPVFLVFIIIVNGFFFGFAYVSGDSMTPNYHDGDFVVIYHASDNYQLGDVIIIQNEEKLIKRIEAMPGSLLRVNQDGVYVDGTLVETSIRPGFVAYDGVIPDGYYFVMGDNRDNSSDSRYFGLVADTDILGIVIYPKRPLA